jgi:GTP-binding protein
MDEIKFIKSASGIKDLPSDNLPEVVLCGRSNVGKSSFINSLFRKKNLAKTSSTPGKTRTLNYYRVQNRFYLVDLPGFGYAKVSKKEREAWNKLIKSYFNNTGNIMYAIHFIDSRHEPTELDIMLNRLLNSFDIPCLILLNKIDKCKQSDIAKAVRNIKTFFPNASIGDNVILHSSVTGRGRKEIYSFLQNLFGK